MYYIFLLIYGFAILTGISSHLGSKNDLTITNILLHITFLHALSPIAINKIIGVAWYIGDLALFYFLALVLYKFIRSLENACIFFCGSIIVGYLLSSVLNAHPLLEDIQTWSSYMWTFSLMAQLPSMALGIMFYYIFNTDLLKGFRHSRKLSYTLTILSLYLIACLTTGYRDLGGSYNIGISYMVLYSIAFSGIMLGLKLHDIKIINNCFFSSLGKRSYSIFLVHYLVIVMMNTYWPVTYFSIYVDWLVKYIATVIVSYGFSFISMKFIEIPFMNWGNKIIVSLKDNSKQ